MRIRTIKPEFFLHEELFALEKETNLPCRVAFIGLWCAADREGRFKWEPRRLGIQILPYDEVDFSRVLHALTTRGFLVKYASNTGEFGFIPGFKRHQVINFKERESNFPEPPQTFANQVVDATGTREARVDDALSTRDIGKGREGKGKEQDNAASATPSLIGSKSSVSKANPPALPTESFSTPPVPPTPQFLDFPVDANRVSIDGGASKKPIAQAPPETTFKAEFEKLWCEAYVAKFGAKYNYEGGRDGKAVKELEATKNSPATLIEIAKLAWDVPDGKNLYCQHSMTIHGFRRHINNIQAETAKHGGADAMTAPDALMDKLNVIAKRPSGSRWTTAEVSALKPFRDITDEDLSKLKTYYHAKIADKAQDWRRQTLLSMLQNLPGELDKARRFKPATCF